MIGPGEYVPDVTEGIGCVDDLPQPKVTVDEPQAIPAALAHAVATVPDAGAAPAPCTT